MKMQPEQIAKYFFQSLMHNQCHICWGLFSKRSQDEFLKWTMQDIYQRHSSAAETAKLGIPEIRLLFENNDASLMKTFWKRFFFNSNANDFFRYGYFNPKQVVGKQAVIQVVCQYPDGRSVATDLTLVDERGGWKLAYYESGLPF